MVSPPVGRYEMCHRPPVKCATVSLSRVKVELTQTPPVPSGTRSPIPSRAEFGGDTCRHVPSVRRKTSVRNAPLEVLVLPATHTTPSATATLFRTGPGGADLIAGSG